MRRSDQRRDAVFALYQRQVTGRPLDELLAGAKPFTRGLAEGAEARRAELDEEIGRLFTDSGGTYGSPQITRDLR